MAASFVWAVCVLCLVGHAIASVPRLDGRWVTQNIDKDVHIEIDVCSVVTKGEGESEEVEIFARLADVSNSKFLFMYGHYVKFFRVSEYRGHFYGQGYPLFSGPGFEQTENCFYHEFRWNNNEIVFRCNFDDYTTVTLHKMTSLRPTNDTCLLLGEGNLMGRYGGGAFDGVACLDQKPNTNKPFRLRMHLKGFQNSEEATIVGTTYLDGRIASGQLYTNDASPTEPGVPMLLLRVRQEIFLITEFFIHVSTYLDAAPFDRCEFNEYGPQITGTYESPYPGLPEVFVCEWKGYLRIMFGYVGVFIGHYSATKDAYDTVWVEAGYPLNPKSGEALLHFTEDGLVGVGYTIDEKRYSFDMKRLSRGVFPSRYCLMDDDHYTSDEGFSISGGWAYPNKEDPKSDSRLAICVTRDEDVTDSADTDAYSIGHEAGHTEFGTYNASYGVGQAYAVGGFEMGRVFREETVASGLFHEPDNVQGFTLSVLSKPNEIYNIFIYENEMNGFDKGFHRPVFGLYRYKRIDSNEDEAECNYFIDNFVNAANSLHVTTLACVTTLCLFLLTSEW